MSLENKIIIVQEREDASASKVKYWVGLIVITISNLWLIFKYISKHEKSDSYLAFIPFYIILTYIIALGDNLFRIYICSLPFILNWAWFMIFVFHVNFIQKKLP